MCDVTRPILAQRLAIRTRCGLACNVSALNTKALVAKGQGRAVTTM